MLPLRVVFAQRIIHCPARSSTAAHDRYEIDYAVRALWLFSPSVDPAGQVKKLQRRVRRDSHVETASTPGSTCSHPWGTIVIRTLHAFQATRRGCPDHFRRSPVPVASGCW